MDVIYHPISTNDPIVQETFNNGLTAYFAFDYHGAYLFFKQCAEIEPHLAIAYWGMANAKEKLYAKKSGVDRENGVSPTDDETLQTLIKKAQSLSQNSSANEKAYIHALAQKFSDEKNEKVRLKAYSEAMKQVSIDFPDDLDGAIFYTESLLDGENWVMWKDGVAKPDAKKVVNTLESVLKRDPKHVGANHYYIHTMESAKDLMSAMMSANYFFHLDTEWGHYVHSASHIFLPLGYYEESVEANKRGIEIDKKYGETHPEQQDYRKQSIKHELFFLWTAYLWEENYQKAIDTANTMTALILPLIQTHPEGENELLLPLKTLIYFHRWDEILALNEPDPHLSALNLFWHFARAMAYLGIDDIENGEKEISIFKSHLEKFKSPISFYQFRLSHELYDATLAYKKGDLKGSINKLYDLAKKQDSIGYFEWFYPFRQTLAAKLIETKSYEDAELVLRKSLLKYPRNGRTLFGLSEALRLQGKDTFWVEREAASALQFSDITLSLRDF